MKLTLSTLYIHLILFLTCSTTIAISQESAYFDNTFEEWTKAQEYFDLELYGQVIHHIDLYLERTRDTEESKKKLNNFIEALSIKHISQLRLELPEGEENLKNFINQNCKINF